MLLEYQGYNDVQGVVHVAINYRLGALGFTALEGEAWGNQGLRDQVLGIIIIFFVITHAKSIYFRTWP